MKFQGDVVVVFFIQFLQQLLGEVLGKSQFLEVPFEKSAAMMSVIHNNTSAKNSSTSFFICIAVVSGRTNVKTKRLRPAIKSVKHIQNMTLLQAKQIKTERFIPRFLLLDLCRK